MSGKISAENAPYKLHVSEDDAKAAVEAIKHFQRSLIAPGNQDLIEEFHLVCTAYAIEWDDTSSFYGDDNSELIMLSIDIHEMSEGRYGAISAGELHSLMFDGPQGGAMIEALFMSLQWERDRAVNGELPGVHHLEIEKNLTAVHDLLFAGAKAERF